MSNTNGTSKWTFWLAGLLAMILLSVILPAMANAIIKNKEIQITENKEIRKEITEGDKEVKGCLKEEIKEIKNEIGKKIDKIEDKIQRLRMESKLDQEKLRTEQQTLGKTQMKILTILERIEKKEN